jgi:hypothetical protein
MAEGRLVGRAAPASAGAGRRGGLVGVEQPALLEVVMHFRGHRYRWGADRARSVARRHSFSARPESAAGGARGGISIGTAEGVRGIIAIVQSITLRFSDGPQLPVGVTVWYFYDL